MTETARNPENDVRIVTVGDSASNTLLYLLLIFILYIDVLKYRTYTFTPLVGKTKLANTLYAKQLQKELDAKGVPITVMSVDPGSVDTPGFRIEPSLNLPLIGHIIRLWAWLSFTTPEVGAYGTVLAAAGSAVREDREKYKGAFIVPPGKIGTPPAPQADSEDLAKELWETTESVCKTLGV